MAASAPTTAASGLAALGLQPLIGAGLSYSLAGLLGVLTAPPLAIWGTLAALEYVHYRSANDGT